VNRKGGRHSGRSEAERRNPEGSGTSLALGPSFRWGDGNHRQLEASPAMTIESPFDELRGCAGPGLSTGEIMAITRGDHRTQSCSHLALTAWRPRG
ncbi:MAG: hypothetical protein ACREFQ_20055, partial [Stellaceae bacterium]